MFSPEMKDLLGPKNAPYFSGAIAQILIARYFHLQLACGAVAILHLVGEWVYLGKTPRGPSLALLMGLVLIELVGGNVLQPKLKVLHKAKYFNASPLVRESADHSFKIWHGVSQAINLLMLAGLATYVWRVANPADHARFVSTTKFRG